MRLPFSNHWKTAMPIPTKLYKIYRDIDDIEMEEVTSEDDIQEDVHTYFPPQAIFNLYDNIKEDFTKFRVDLAGTPEQQRQVDGDTETVNAIPIRDVVRTLADKYETYPKELK